MADPITATVSAIATSAAAAAGAAASFIGFGTAGVGAIKAFTLAATPYLLQSAVTFAATALLTPSVDVEGSPTTWRADPNAGIPFVIGERAVAGKIVHRDEYGEDNRYQSIVTVISGAGPIEALDDFSASEVSVSFGANGIATNGGNYASNMWLQTSLGDQPQATALQQTGLPGGSPGIQGWGASSKISGKAHTFLTLRQDSKGETYPAGVPRVLHTVRGIKFYDPRLDSTYPGGSGTHRLNDRSTWAYSENPYIAALNWVLGLTENDVLVGGVGAALEGVDVAAFIEGANVADTNGWVVSAVPTSRDSKFQVLQGLLQAGGGRYISNRGKISCLVRTAKTSVATITAEDTAGPISLNLNADRLTAVNSITPRCFQENQDWELVDQPEVTEASYVTADGGKRQESVDYPYVAIKADGSNDDQVAQLAAYDLVYSREAIAGSIPLKPYLGHVGPGDVITISDPDGDLQLDGVTLQVVTRSFNPQTNISTVEVVSETAANHTYALGLTNTPPAAQGLTQADVYAVDAPTAGDWSVSALSGNTPTIEVTNTITTTPNPLYQLEIKPSASSDWTVYGQFKSAAEVVDITGLEPNTEYNLAVRAVSSYGVLSDRTTIGTVTTGGTGATGVVPGSDLDTSIGSIEDEIAAAADALSSGAASLDVATAQARDDIDAGKARADRILGEVLSNLSGLTATAGFSASENQVRKTEIVSLNVTVDGVSATATSALNATIDLENNKAEASDLTALEARVTTNEGDITTAESDITTLQATTVDLENNKAEASDLTALEARVTTNEGDIDTNAASIVTLDTATAEADRAQAQRLSRALAEIAANSAEAISATNVVADRNRVEATRTTSLEAQVGTDDGNGSLFARVATNESAVTDLDANKAEASDLTALEARVTTNEGDVDDAQADATTALGQIVTLDAATAEADRAQARRLSRALAEVAANAAQAISGVNVVADDTRVEATRVEALTARVGDAEASVTTNASAIADIEGNLEATWGVTLDVNGHITGIQSTNDGTTGTFVITADEFFLAGSTTDKTPFAMIGDDVFFSDPIHIDDGAGTPTTRAIVGPLADGMALWLGSTSETSSTASIANAKVALTEDGLRLPTESSTAGSDATVGGTTFTDWTVVGRHEMSETVAVLNEFSFAGTELIMASPQGTGGSGEDQSTWDWALASVASSATGYEIGDVISLPNEILYDSRRQQTINSSGTLVSDTSVLLTSEHGGGGTTDISVNNLAAIERELTSLGPRGVTTGDKAILLCLSRRAGNHSLFTDSTTVVRVSKIRNHGV